MATAALQLKTLVALPCSRIPAIRSRRITGSCGFSTGAKQRINHVVLREKRGLRRRGEWGTKFLVSAEANAEDSSVAVEDVAEDEEQQLSAEEDEEQQLSPEDEEDAENIREILRVVELLRTKRDMTFNEARLTIMIEDPREVERRKQLNIEDERGCSREELAAALVEVYEGRVPQDRITLRELTKEMLNWPNLEDEIYPGGRTPPIASPYAKVTDTGVDPRVAASRAKIDWDSAAEIQPGEEKKDLSEVLPPAVGFSFLYLISAIPVIIGVAVVVILFLNSLQ